MDRISIRVATPDDGLGIARVKVETWRYAYKNILDSELLKNLDTEKDAERWRERLSRGADREQCWVACEASRVVGFLYVGPNRFPEVDCDGELQAIYVIPSLHRRGVGGMLLKPAIDWMVVQGFESMAVFVFRDNPIGVGFYKSMGAVFNDSGDLEIGGKNYPDESYVWKSLTDLQMKLQGQ